MPNQFRLYPRGFLGDYNNKPVAHMYDASAAIMLVLRNADTAPHRYKMLGLPNQVLDTLYQDLLSIPCYMERFAWREELLRAALKAFGTDSLSEWVKAQSSSPYCGKYHKNFINDCLRFANGDSRLQAISSWNNLISDEDLEAGGRLPTSEEGYMFNGKFLAEASIADLIKSWCSQEEGYSDMVISLNILFGRYDGLY